jgi:hypothetical protein
MIQSIASITPSSITKAAVLSCLALAALPAMAQDQQPAATQPKCPVNLMLAGKMSDIVSNALMRGLKHPELDVRKFLDGAEIRYSSGPELLKAAAAHFGVQEAVLTSAVERYRHTNCDHDDVQPGPKVELTAFARDVTLHVVLHELGHALIREFDLPVLGNEETTADAFATHYLTAYLPDRALDVLSARTRSLMIEANEIPRETWSVSGEHNSDARRAYQIAALALAADPQKYMPVAAGIGMPENDVRSARDYATEIHRSWRRILQPLWMPDGVASNEARLVCDSLGGVVDQLCANGLADEFRTALERFDWHSQVTLRFVDGEGGAGWSRSKRTITVHGDYVRRFVEQGRLARD